MLDRLRHPVRAAVAIALLTATAAGGVVADSRGPGPGSEPAAPAPAPAGAPTAPAAPTLASASAPDRRLPANSAPRPPQRHTIVAAGDVACDPRSSMFNGGLGTGEWCQARETARSIARLDPEAVLVLGDTQYDDARAAAYDQSYDQSWGRYLGRTFPVPGNHEYYTSGARGYFSYYGSRAGHVGEGWYSFDVGNWHVIGLNSNCSIVGCERGTRQYRWLRRDLEADRSACSIAFMHHPLVSSGPHGDEVAGTMPLWRLLYRDGLDVALVSHDHIYERFAPLTPDLTRDAETGIRQFVVGTGGAQHYWIEQVRQHSRVRNTKTFGVLRLWLGRRGYSWRFVPITRGAFTDSGTGDCHGAPAAR